MQRTGWFVTALLLGACGEPQRPAVATTLVADAGSRDVDAAIPHSTVVCVNLNSVFPRKGCADCGNLSVIFLIELTLSLSETHWKAVRSAIGGVVTRLGPNDNMAVVSLESQPVWMLPMGHPQDDMAVSKLFEGIQEGGQSDYFRPLLEAWETAIMLTRSKRAHIVLIGSGDAPQVGLMRKLAQSIACQGMSLSTIAIGTSIEPTLLQMLAEKGGGKFYDASDPSKLDALVRSDLDEQLAAP